MKRLAISLLCATALALAACSEGETTEGQEAVTEVTSAIDASEVAEAPPEPTPTTAPETTASPKATTSPAVAPRAASSPRATATPKRAPTVRPTATPKAAEEPKVAECTPEHREIGHC